ncbi:MAG: hypothetical protein WKG32_02980 [Gemmatimonadaceae bacterium]
MLLVWLSNRREVGGVEVCVAGTSMEANSVSHKVEAALRLIAQNDPALAGQICRDVRRLLFTETSGGHYLAGIETCRIGLAYATRVPPIELAMMIVHEATHARLAKGGALYLGEDRGRIEHICVEAEIAFAERIPGSEHAVQKARALLKTEWWDAEKHSERTVSDLRQRGVPEWIAQRIVAWSLRRVQKE